LRAFFSGLLIGNDSFTPETGLIKMREGLCDAISFGRLYISNPDLAERIINNWEINNKWDFKTFYGTQHGPIGLVDYPFYSQQ
jgi:N-ethylmaleimide reductase